MGDYKMLKCQVYYSDECMVLFLATTIKRAITKAQALAYSAEILVLVIHPVGDERIIKCSQEFYNLVGKTK